MIWTLALVWYSLGLASIAAFSRKRDSLTICQAVTLMVIAPPGWILASGIAILLLITVFNLPAKVWWSAVVAIVFITLLTVFVAFIGYSLSRNCRIIWKRK